MSVVYFHDLYTDEALKEYTVFEMFILEYPVFYSDLLEWVGLTKMYLTIFIISCIFKHICYSFLDLCVC